MTPPKPLRFGAKGSAVKKPKRNYVPRWCSERDASAATNPTYTPWSKMNTQLRSAATAQCPSGFRPQDREWIVSDRGQVVGSRALPKGT